MSLSIDDLQAKMPQRLVAVDIIGEDDGPIWVITDDGDWFEYDEREHQLWLER